MTKSGSDGAKVVGAQTLDRAVALLQLIGTNDDAGLRPADLISQSGLTAPTVHRLLKSLESHRFIERDKESGRFHLGVGISALGNIAAQRTSFEEMAKGSLKRIAEASGDTALLNFRRGWHSVCVASVEGSYPIRSHVLQVGDRHPLGVSSGGMAILATLEDWEVLECLEANREELETRFPSFKKDQILEQVEETRSTGRAINRGQIYSESYGLAVAVRTSRVSFTTAITIAGISSRFSKDRISILEDLLNVEAVKLLC